MAIKGARSIAEYAIRKWMAQEGLVEEYFSLTVKGNEGFLADREGNYLELEYEPLTKMVHVKE